MKNPYRKNSKAANAYADGFNHGHGLACHNVPTIGDRIDRSVDYVGCGDLVDAENIREYHELLCHAAADHSRCYSPFEYTASEFNRSKQSEKLWEAFEAGTAAAIGADLATYTDEDYGIESE